MMNRLFDAILVFTFVAIPCCIPSRLSAQESEIQLLPPISGSDDGSISTEVTSEELLGEELLTEASTDVWTPWSTSMGWFNSPIWDFGFRHLRKVILLRKVIFEWFYSGFGIQSFQKSDFRMVLFGIWAAVTSEK